MIKIIKEDPVSTSYITDVDTYIIPNVSEDDADKIINFAFKSDAVEDCAWNSGKIEITCDSFIFQMILIWAYRKGFISGNMRVRDILRDNGINEKYKPNNLKNYIKEAPDSKARYEIAENIASWVFGSPNMNDIDDNIDFLVTRFMKGSTLVDRMYMCDTYEELADVLSNCSLKLLMDIERGLCIDEDSISCETDYIKKMYEESKKRLREQDVEIEVKHEGILEVPEGKNVEDLPVSHFVNLAKKKGLSKITKALNNLQVWNKKKNPSLSKWAGDMIDKVSKKMDKKESLTKLKEDSLDDFIKPEIKKRYIWPLYDDSAYEISEIIEKYQNTNRFKNEIKSFDLKDISYMDWPALQLEIECSYEAYVLIRKDIEREGLYMDDDEFDESLKLKESGIEKWINKKSLKTKHESYPRYKR